MNNYDEGALYNLLALLIGGEGTDSSGMRVTRETPQECMQRRGGNWSAAESVCLQRKSTTTAGAHFF
ncbi:hypothetical protein B4N84_01765 [Flavobacterium sp. IR1]|nr:hypothetical protein B4N84_01765 [Flavobacterium sp. IR1]